MLDKTIIFNNTIKKIFKQINLNNLHLIGQTQSGWRDTNFEFVCPEHGPFNITGYGIRLGGNKLFCKRCLDKTGDIKINLFESMSLSGRKEFMINSFPNLDWSDFIDQDFCNIDHSIRPSCQMHGELITSPRRLILGDSCKWCDSVKEEDGEYKLDINHDSFIKEKLSFYYPTSNAIKLDKFRYLIDSQVIEIKNLKGNINYLNHLKEVRSPEYHNTIFFKLIIIDKSSKFQFSIVYYINLDEQWVNWYRAQLLDNDENIAQTIVTNKIISTWIKLFIGELFLYEIQWSFWSNIKRVETWYNDYISKNDNKKLILPEAIDSKLAIKFKDMNVNSYWSENKWESTSNSISMIRESHMKLSDICPICKKKIINPVVDHEHSSRIFGTGRIRDTICSNCNVFIAKVENNCKRYGTSIEELPEVLKNISEYFTTQQYNIIHYTEKDGKPILSKTLANKILKYWVHLFDGKKKKIKYPRSGIITKEWEEAILEFNKFDENKISFSKNEYKILLTKINSYNINVNISNIGLSKTKMKKLFDIPEYPITKYITPKIQNIMDNLNGKD